MTIQNRAIKDTEQGQLREFVPINDLSDSGLDKLTHVIRIGLIPKGSQLFCQGDSDALSIFLLDGEVQLISEENQILVAAHSEGARYALASLKPRRYTGNAVTDVKVAYLESTLLDRIMAWDQISRDSEESIQVQEYEGVDDPEWFLQMLDSQIFANIPAANVQSLVSKFEAVPVKAGDVIIQQGDVGDEYFVIRQGSCEVIRSSGDNVFKLAERYPGEGLGEEALIENKPRDATVRMLTDGLVVRLKKDDFDLLLKEPLLNWINEDEVLGSVDEGTVLVDVRLENEFEHETLRNAINIPLYLFRLKAEQLNPDKKYIVFCDTGTRSATAAFLLGVRNFNASVIRGGIDSCPRLARS